MSNNEFKLKGLRETQALFFRDLAKYPTCHNFLCNRAAEAGAGGAGYQYRLVIQALLRADGITTNGEGFGYPRDGSAHIANERRRIWLATKIAELEGQQ